MSDDPGVLSSARITTHDALTGYWDPPHGNASVDWDPDPDDLSYLSADRRLSVLLAQIVGKFSYEKSAGKGKKGATVKLAFCDKDICSIAVPSVDVLGQQMKWLRAYADLREDRATEIMLQAEEISSSFSAVRPFDLQNRATTAEILDLVQDVAVLVEMQIKHSCRLPRPVEFSDHVHPILDTPTHSTFPSGHATEAFAIATTLALLEHDETPQEALKSQRQVFYLAHRIAVNRTVAGVHYPVDSGSGAALGCAIGCAVAAMATGEKAQMFTSSETDQASFDFTREKMKTICASQDVALKDCDHSALTRLWEEARDEWKRPDGRPRPKPSDGNKSKAKKK